MSAELKASVARVMEEGTGFWRSCSGCYETNEGYDTAPQDPTFRVPLGGGCDECGGIGAVWDTIEYDAISWSDTPPHPGSDAFGGYLPKGEITRIIMRIYDQHRAHGASHVRAIAEDAERDILAALSRSPGPDDGASMRHEGKLRDAISDLPNQSGERSGWRPIETAPKDGTYILARMGQTNVRWMHLSGRTFAIRHEGKLASGYDLGWAVYPGFGGAPDEWFAGWQPLPRSYS